MKKMRFFLIAFILILSAVQGAFAQTDRDVEILSFSSEAFSKDRIVYREKHEAEYRSGRIARAKTDYISESGETLAYIESFFNDSLTAPAHVFEDFRFKDRHGARYEAGDVILFTVREGGKEETRNVGKDFGSSVLMVGCQGFFYYLQENYQVLRERGKIPLKLLITGDLDIYDFEMELKDQIDGIAYINIHISNWFLRLFAPKLELRYDIADKKLLYYKGLSNILDEKRKLQNVEIFYKY
ncbi:MAG: hypothetical protein RBT69_12730 [Spirochaetia bacterium]|jgi:hypothetical protein|nr:hypothetical protein [Spirochaetia bacterium]